MSIGWKSFSLEEAIAKIDTAEGVTAELFDEKGEGDAKKILPYLRPYMAVLDFGAGIGRIAKHIAPSVDILFCYDPETSMCVYGRKWCHGLDNLVWLWKLDSIPENSLDFVYSFLTFQHIPFDDYMLDIKKIAYLMKSKAEGLFHYLYLDKEYPYHSYTVKNVVASLLPFFSLQKIMLDDCEPNRFFTVLVKRRG